MGHSAKAFRRSAGDPDWGVWSRAARGRTVASADGRAGQIPSRLLAAFGAERAVRRPMGRDLRRPLNGTFAALPP